MRREIVMTKERIIGEIPFILTFSFQVISQHWAFTQLIIPSQMCKKWTMMEMENYYQIRNFQTENFNKTSL